MSKERAFKTLYAGREQIFVDSGPLGNDANPGYDWGAPKKTLKAAMAACLLSGIVLIRCRGEFLEQDVTFEQDLLTIDGPDAEISLVDPVLNSGGNGSIVIACRQFVFAGTTGMTFNGAEKFTVYADNIALTNTAAGVVMTNAANLVALNANLLQVQTADAAKLVDLDDGILILDIANAGNLSAAGNQYIVEQAGGTVKGNIGSITNLSSGTMSANNYTAGINELMTGGVAVGATPANVSEVTRGGNPYYVTRLTLNNFDIGAIAAAANEAIGAEIFEFPNASGTHIVLAARQHISLVGDAAIQTDTPDLGLGSVVATGAVAVLGGTATFEDYITGQTMSDCNGSAKDSGLLVPTAGAFTGIALNNVGDSENLFLNVADGWAAASSKLLASGTIDIVWIDVSTD